MRIKDPKDAKDAAKALNGVTLPYDYTLNEAPEGCSELTEADFPAIETALNKAGFVIVRK